MAPSSRVLSKRGRSLSLTEECGFLMSSSLRKNEAGKGLQSARGCAGKPETAGTRRSFNRRQTCKYVTYTFIEIGRVPSRSIACKLQKSLNWNAATSRCPLRLSLGRRLGRGRHGTPYTFALHTNAWEEIIRNVLDRRDAGAVIGHETEFFFIRELSCYSLPKWQKFSYGTPGAAPGGAG